MNKPQHFFIRNTIDGAALFTTIQSKIRSTRSGHTSIYKLAADLDHVNYFSSKDVIQKTRKFTDKRVSVCLELLYVFVDLCLYFCNVILGLSLLLGKRLTSCQIYCPLPPAYEVESTREGNVLTPVCLSVHGGYPHPA